MPLASIYSIKNQAWFSLWCDVCSCLATFLHVQSAWQIMGVELHSLTSWCLAPLIQAYTPMFLLPRIPIEGECSVKKCLLHVDMTEVVVIKQWLNSNHLKLWSNQSAGYHPNIYKVWGAICKSRPPVKIPNISPEWPLTAAYCSWWLVRGSFGTGRG